MSCSERREREKKKVHDSIINAALDIASKKGWHAVTIRKIAEAVEYAPPIVYQYFESKEALFNELILMGMKMMHGNFDDARKEHKDPKKILLHLSLNHWHFAFKYRVLYKLMFSFERPIPNEEIRYIFGQIKSLFYELVDDEVLAHEIMFNWMCLQQGYIFNIMKIGLPPSLSSKQPEKLFKEAIERFIKAI